VRWQGLADASWQKFGFRCSRALDLVVADAAGRGLVSIVARMYQRAMVLSHRPTREGSTVAEAHVPAYLALELATTAFADALPKFTDGALEGEDVVIAHLEASFARELLVGDVDVDVVLRKIGRSSLHIEVALAQDTHSAGSFRFVLVHIVNGRSAEISSDLREVLQNSVE